MARAESTTVNGTTTLGRPRLKETQGIGDGTDLDISLVAGKTHSDRRAEAMHFHDNPPLAGFGLYR